MYHSLYPSGGLHSTATDHSKYLIELLKLQDGNITNVSTYELSRDNAEPAYENADAVEGVSCILDD